METNYPLCLIFKKKKKNYKFSFSILLFRPLTLESLGIPFFHYKALSISPGYSEEKLSVSIHYINYTTKGKKIGGFA